MAMSEVRTAIQEERRSYRAVLLQHSLQNKLAYERNHESFTSNGFMATESDGDKADTNIVTGASPVTFIWLLEKANPRHDIRLHSARKYQNR